MLFPSSYWIPLVPRHKTPTRAGPGQKEQWNPKKIENFRFSLVEGLGAFVELRRRRLYDGLSDVL